MNDDSGRHLTARDLWAEDMSRRMFSYGYLHDKGLLWIPPPWQPPYGGPDPQGAPVLDPNGDGPGPRFVGAVALPIPEAWCEPEDPVRHYIIPAKKHA